MRDLIVSPRLTIPASELSVAVARSGGPGGQNVNKVATKVELRWNVAASAVLGEGDRAWLLDRLAGRLTRDGELIVTSTLTRDQLRNRDDAMDKLARLVRDALVRPVTRRATRPTRASKRRRVEGKRHRAQVKAQRRGVD
jgi:ribosome-associated protein